MNRKALFTLVILLLLAALCALPATAEVDAPIEVVSSALERTAGGLAMVPLEGAMTFLYNNVTDSSGQFNEAPENLMHYSLTYTMAEPKDCLIKLTLTGPDGEVERENTLPLGNAEEGEENTFGAIILAASGAAGEYTAELYIDGVLADTVTFAD